MLTLLITLLVASTRSEVVADFLDNTEISIEVLNDFQNPKIESGKLATTDVEGNTEADANGLMLEVVSKTFGPSTKAFTLKFVGKNTVEEVGSRGLIAEYESSLFIEGFIIDYISFGCGSTCNPNILVEHWSRSCALCSYKLYAYQSLAPGTSWSTCKDARRTKAKIFGDYPVSFYTWNFTFWNCA
jgi:hypothetical protein